MDFHSFIFSISAPIEQVNQITGHLKLLWYYSQLYTTVSNSLPWRAIRVFQYSYKTFSNNRQFYLVVAAGCGSCRYYCWGTLVQRHIRHAPWVFHDKCQRTCRLHWYCPWPMFQKTEPQSRRHTPPPFRCLLACNRSNRTYLRLYTVQSLRKRTIAIPWPTLQNPLTVIKKAKVNIQIGKHSYLAIA